MKVAMIVKRQEIVWEINLPDYEMEKSVEISFPDGEMKQLVESIPSNLKTELVEFPTEGKWFKVNPDSINCELFKNKRRNSSQEWTRRVILMAFAQVEAKPEKYCRPFETLIPEKTWLSKTVKELIDLAGNFGGHLADWVEQALEWAQRLHNGETWETICDEADTANWYRLIVWKYGYIRNIGGSRKNFLDFPASYLSHIVYSSDDRISSTVPLVARYE